MPRISRGVRYYYLILRSNIDRRDNTALEYLSRQYRFCSFQSSIHKGPAGKEGETTSHGINKNRLKACALKNPYIGWCTAELVGFWHGFCNILIA